MKNNLPIKIDLPGGFLEAETRCGHLISQKMKEVWAVELDLLIELLRVCEKHKIKIFASGGTLLGAIRHKGMIPWDDDIDMMMLREDYDKLCEIAPKEFRDPYFFQTAYNDVGCTRTHAQLRNSRTTAILKTEKEYATFNQGIFIDIFPLDAVVDDQELFEQQSKQADRLLTKMGRYNRLSICYDRKATKGLKGAVKAMVYPFTNVIFRKLNLAEKNFRKFESMCKKYNHMETEKVSTFSFGLDKPEFFQYRCDFEEIIYVPFEFLSIPIGKVYERALVQQYGDWQKFVVGGSLHGEVFFDTRKSYTNYIDM